MMNIIRNLKNQNILPLLFRGLNSHHALKTLDVSNPVFSSTRSFSGICAPIQIGLLPNNNKNFTSNSSNFLWKAKSIQMDFIRTYKVKHALRLRCDHCYFVKRMGRLYVECKKKPRHKQMQFVPKKQIYRDDYSEGKIQEACFWKFRQDRWYRLGNNKFGNMNWLEGRLGTEV